MLDRLRPFRNMPATYPKPTGPCFDKIAVDSASPITCSFWMGTSLGVQEPCDCSARAGGDRAGDDRTQAELGDLAAALRHHCAHTADQNAERAEIRKATQRIGDDH